MVNKVGWYINNKEYVCVILVIVVFICLLICYLDDIFVLFVGSEFCVNEWCIFWYLKIKLCVWIILNFFVVNFELLGY